MSEHFSMSIDPATAQRRFDHFRARIDVVEEMIRARKLLGEPESDELERYSWLLRAQLRFARDQIKDLGAAPIPEDPQ